MGLSCCSGGKKRGDKETERQGDDEIPDLVKDTEEPAGSDQSSLEQSIETKTSKRARREKTAEPASKKSKQTKGQSSKPSTAKCEHEQVTSSPKKKEESIQEPTSEELSDRQYDFVRSESLCKRLAPSFRIALGVSKLHPIEVLLLKDSPNPWDFAIRCRTRSIRVHVLTLGKEPPEQFPRKIRVSVFRTETEGHKEKVLNFEWTGNVKNIDDLASRVTDMFRPAYVNGWPEETPISRSETGKPQQLKTTPPAGRESEQKDGQTSKTKSNQKLPTTSSDTSDPKTTQNIRVGSGLSDRIAAFNKAQSKKDETTAESIMESFKRSMTSICPYCTYIDGPQVRRGVHNLIVLCPQGSDSRTTDRPSIKIAFIIQENGSRFGTEFKMYKRVISHLSQEDIDAGHDGYEEGKSFTFTYLDDEHLQDKVEEFIKPKLGEWKGTVKWAKSEEDETDCHVESAKAETEPTLEPYTPTVRPVELNANEPNSPSESSTPVTSAHAKPKQKKTKRDISPSSRSSSSSSDYSYSDNSYSSYTESSSSIQAIPPTPGQALSRRRHNAHNHSHECNTDEASFTD